MWMQKAVMKLCSAEKCIQVDIDAEGSHKHCRVNYLQNRVIFPVRRRNLCYVRIYVCVYVRTHNHIGQYKNSAVPEQPHSCNEKE